MAGSIQDRGHLDVICINNRSKYCGANVKAMILFYSVVIVSVSIACSQTLTHFSHDILVVHNFLAPMILTHQLCRKKLKVSFDFNYY